jgi:hypothetical protein
MEEVKGMAPTPSQMARMRQAGATKPPEKSKSNKKGGSNRTTIRSDSPPLGLKSDVMQILYGLHWTYQKRVLDLAQVAVPSKKWDTFRTIMMDIITEQVETQRTLVGRRITDHLAEQDLKEKLSGYEFSDGTQ